MAMRKGKRVSRVIWVRSGERVFTLEVYLISGPLTREFAKRNPVVKRTIEIRGWHTLQDLHFTIFKAFGRREEHAYEFQVGGTAPMDPKARVYTALPGLMGILQDTGTVPAGDVSWTAIGNLDLKIGDVFGYWFDYGDSWWHQINVLGIEPKAGRGTYPRIVERIGESPPQGVALKGKVRIDHGRRGT